MVELRSERSQNREKDDMRRCSLTPEAAGVKDPALGRTPPRPSPTCEQIKKSVEMMLDFHQQLKSKDGIAVQASEKQHKINRWTRLKLATKKMFCSKKCDSYLSGVNQSESDLPRLELHPVTTTRGSRRLETFPVYNNHTSNVDGTRSMPGLAVPPKAYGDHTIR